MRRKVNGTRKIQVLVMMSRDEIHWLDKKSKAYGSRSALIRYIIQKAMEKGIE